LLDQERERGGVIDALEDEVEMVRSMKAGAQNLMALDEMLESGLQRLWMERALEAEQGLDCRLMTGLDERPAEELLSREAKAFEDVM
jgi:hypothetical protein